MRLKWECTGTHRIFKGDYAINYVARDSSGRKNRQRNTILIARVKKAKERLAAAAEVVAKEINILGVFSQGSSNNSPRQQESSPRRREGGPGRGGG